jgi:phage baseplate assembly protein W
MPELGTLIGRGIAFPPRLGPDGRLRFSEGAENVRDALRVILMTERRERLMLPGFGAGLGALLFEPNVAATHALLAERARRALERWEPRIRLERLDVAADPEDPQAAVVTVAYRLVATGREEEVTLTVPLAG